LGYGVEVPAVEGRVACVEVFEVRFDGSDERDEPDAGESSVAFAGLDVVGEIEVGYAAWVYQAIQSIRRLIQRSTHIRIRILLIHIF